MGSHSISEVGAVADVAGQLVLLKDVVPLGKSDLSGFVLEMAEQRGAELFQVENVELLHPPPQPVGQPHVTKDQKAIAAGSMLLRPLARPRFLPQVALSHISSAIRINQRRPKVLSSTRRRL